MKSNRDYYDEFSVTYERKRHEGYHAMLDNLEVQEASPYCQDATLLEVGCGTGLILQRLKPACQWAVGVDISKGMLQTAQERNLTSFQGSATALPFSDASFDVVVSFKVLAHVRNLKAALEEMARVTKPGGRLVLEFYNPHSLRYVAKRIRPGRINRSTSESEVFTRWDSLGSLRRTLPETLKLERVRGVRILTPLAMLHGIPVLGTVLSTLERGAMATPLGRFGGFLVLHLRRQ